MMCVAALLWCAAAAAQETTGNISGRLVDAQGLPLPGVTVTATGPQGVKTAVSDTDGRFRNSISHPGVYGIRAELQGFAPIERMNTRCG